MGHWVICNHRPFSLRHTFCQKSFQFQNLYIAHVDFVKDFHKLTTESLTLLSHRQEGLISEWELVFHEMHFQMLLTAELALDCAYLNMSACSCTYLKHIPEINPQI